MKTTDHFKRTIQMYLEQRAAEDALFAKNYRNPAKNIDDCVTYILNYVQKSGCNGFTDGEIYGQAVHYYDENDIEVGKPVRYGIPPVPTSCRQTRNILSSTTMIFVLSIIIFFPFLFCQSDNLRAYIQYGSHGFV